MSEKKDDSKTMDPIQKANLLGFCSGMICGAIVLFAFMCFGLASDKEAAAKFCADVMAVHQ